MKTIRLSATATVLAYNSQALREMIGHRDSIDIFVELHLSLDAVVSSEPLKAGELAGNPPSPGWRGSQASRRLYRLEWATLLRRTISYGYLRR